MSPSLRISVPDPTWLQEFEEINGVEVIVWDGEQKQPDGYLDLVLLPYGAVVDPLSTFDPTRIGVIQSQALGFDGVEAALPQGAVYANAVGVHEANTAELALGLTLTSQRRLDELARQQVAGGWDRPWGVGLSGRRVLVVGFGGIGQQIVRRLDGFDCEVVRIAGTRREDAQGTVHGIGELFGLLPHVDVVIIAVPLTPFTERLVDDKFLSALPDNSLVVNVSRGRITDTDAVLRQQGRVRYATDVVDIEPVPADHPLRFAPGVFMTPHVGGRSLAQRPRVKCMVLRQIELLLAGHEPENIVFRKGTAGP